MQSRREVQRERSRGTSKRMIRDLLILIILIFLVGWSIYAVGNHPKAEAERQATTIAKRYANLKTRTDFYIYNRENTYYTVAGKNNKGQKILVIVPQKNGSVRIVNQSTGLTEQQALAQVKSNEHPKKVLKAVPGIFNDKVVWEVTYLNSKGNLCYDLINFKTGSYVQQINNL
ncbi:cell wall elongation regulator TseB-like domain-containing protein [Limosilactobacillus mucosae]|uniref:cell wall elongation regulator TseB-like domain-containing protein n=1 Tax=Limosilactobacillus mucosae TaxID=97478 RepID=UPI0040391AA3